MTSLNDMPGMKTADAKKRRGWRFYFNLVILFSAAIFGITYYTVSNILAGWDSGRVAKLIGDNIKRKVRLEGFKWQLEIDGIEFQTSRVAIDDLDGTPFIRVEAAKIALALLPLTRGEFFPKRIDLENPEIWAIKRGDQQWNFSDLANTPVDITKYVAMFSCRNGLLHLVDHSKASHRFSDLNIRNIHAHLTRPFGWLAWPYSLAFEVPETKYGTKVQLSGVGTGELADWADSKYSWNLTVSGFDPRELSALGISLPAVQAPVALKLDGSGTLNKGLKTFVRMENPQFFMEAHKAIWTGDLLNLCQTKPSEKPFTALPEGSIVPPNVSGQLELVDSSIALKKEGVSATKAHGKLEFKDGFMTTKGLTCSFGGGSCELKGALHTTHDYSGAVSLKSTDLKEIEKFFGQFKIYEVPADFQPISGVVKEAHLQFSEKEHKASWSLESQPAGLFFQLPSREKIVQLSSGAVKCESGKDFELTEVAGTLGSGNFKMSGKGGFAQDAKLSIVADAANIDLDRARSLLKALRIKLPSTPVDRMQGAVRQIQLAFGGSFKDPIIGIRGTIKQTWVQDKGKSRTFELNGGGFDYRNNVGTLDKVHGTIGKGQFDLDGKVDLSAKVPKMAITLKARDLDLSNVKVALNDLKIETPLLAEELLLGRVRELSAVMTGPSTGPTISASMVPDDVLFQPLGTDRPIHAKNGKVEYANDVLTVKDLAVSTPRGQLTTGLVMEHLSKDSVLTSFVMQSPGLDVGDLNAYLEADRTPPMVRQKYELILSQNQISSPKGKISGQLDYHYNAKSHRPTISGQIHLADVSGTLSGISVRSVNGDVHASGDDITLSGVKGDLGHSRLIASGTINNFADAGTRTWHLTIHGRAFMEELTKLAGERLEQTQDSTSRPLRLSATVNGPENQRTIVFSVVVDPATAISFHTPLGDLVKPTGQGARIDASLSLQQDNTTINSCQLKFGDMVLNGTGSFDNSFAEGQPDGKVNIQVRAPDFLPITTLAAFAPDLPTSKEVESISGTVRGGARLFGTLSELKFRCGAQVKDVTIPSIHVSKLSGSVRTADWIPIERRPTVSTPSLVVTAPSLTIEKLLVSNVTGKLTPNANGSWQYGMDAKLAKGTLNATGEINGKTSTCSLKLNQVSTDDLLRDVLNAPNEMTGTMNVEGDFSCADMTSDIIANLTGTGTLNVSNGKVSRFSLLEKRINQANLLKSGLIGFNLNNLLASVAPVEKGEFQVVKAQFSVDGGHLIVHRAFFKGDELHMRAEGNVDLAKGVAQFEVSGRIPRVSKSGPLGSVAPLLGVRGLADMIEDVPVGLLTGKKDTDVTAARVFAFNVTGAAAKPDTITESIYKSFHWLPTATNATAHPVLHEGGSS